jgi:hypothetical protein
MKLTSLKLSKADAKAEVMPSMADLPEYPYGLSIRLDDASIKKLKLDAEDMEVGKVLQLVARVEVTSYSCNETIGAGKREDVCLQITDASLDEANDTDDSKSLYES